MKIASGFKILFVVTIALLMWGCGSGGDSSRAVGSEKIVSKSVLSGAVPPDVRGIEITLVLPPGVTVNADSAGVPLTGVITTVAPNDVTAGTGSVTAKYTPASATTPGKLKIAIIRTTGFTAGDFLNVTCEVAAGATNISAAQFATEALKVFDNNGAEISGATAEIVATGAAITGP
jgi:hypothetical protein